MLSANLRLAGAAKGGGRWVVVCVSVVVGGGTETSSGAAHTWNAGARNTKLKLQRAAACLL